MKVALISDQHFGVNDFCSKQHKSISLFYEKIFFPYLDDNKIEYLFDLGDTFDKNAKPDDKLIEWSKHHYFDKLKERNIKTLILRGNHNPRRNFNGRLTDAITSVSHEYNNIQLIDNSSVVSVYGKRILMTPYLDFNNNAISAHRKLAATKDLSDTSVDIIFTHMSFSNYNVFENKKTSGGLLIPSRHLKSIPTPIVSGHYHSKSSTLTPPITYLGAPYALKRGEFNVNRGFHALEVDSLKLTFVKNNFQVFDFICVDSFADLLEKFKEIDLESKFLYIISELTQKSEISKINSYLDKEGHKSVSHLHTVKMVEEFVDELMFQKDYDEALTLLNHSNKILKNNILDLQFAYCVSSIEKYTNKTSNLIFNTALLKSLETAKTPKNLKEVIFKVKHLSHQYVANQQV